MSNIPKFGDIGKDTCDLFKKKYDYDVTKLKVVTNTSNGVKFTVDGKRKADNSVCASIESKYAAKDQGFELVEKWDTCSNLDVSAKLSKLVDGLTLKAACKFTDGDKKDALSGSVEGTYKHENATAVLKVSSENAAPTINGSVVFGHAGFVAGFSGKFVSGAEGPEDLQAKLGYQNDSMQATAWLSDAAKKFGFSLYNKVSDDCTVGAKVCVNDADVSLVVGGDCKLDDSASIRAKVDSDAKVGVAYTQSLRKGVSVNVAAEFQQPAGATGPSTQVGFGFTFEDCC